MSVTGVTGNNFPGTSQLSRFYVKRRFVDKEIYEKYLTDIESLLNINRPKITEYNIPEEKRNLLDSVIQELESKLAEVSNLYAISEELNYKSAEKEIAELNKILDQYLADIKEELSNLNYKTAEYYVKRKLIEYYQSNYKNIVDIFSNNKKIILENDTLLILGNDGIIYGIGSNELHYLTSENIDYYKYLIKVPIDNNEKIVDFEFYKNEIICLTESGKLLKNSNIGYVEDNYEDLYFIRILGNAQKYGIVFLAYDYENKPRLVYLGDNRNYFYIYPNNTRYKLLETGNSENEFISKVTMAKLGENSIVLFNNINESYKVGFIGRNIYGHFGVGEETVDEFTFSVVSPGVISENYTGQKQKDRNIRIIPDNSLFDSGDGTSYALDTSHTLYVTGSNKCGELGIDSDEEFIDSWTKVEQFDKNVLSVLFTDKKGILVTLKNVYEYKNDEDKIYKNEKEDTDSNSMWVCGKNDPSDPLYGIPTVAQLNTLKETFNLIDMNRFDEFNDIEILDITQTELTEILQEYAELYGKIESIYNLYTSTKIKKWVRVYPGEDTDYCLREYYTEIENLIERSNDLYNRIIEYINSNTENNENPEEIDSPATEEPEENIPSE